MAVERIQGRNSVSISSRDGEIFLVKKFGEGSDSLRRLRASITWDEIATVNKWQFTPRITRSDLEARVIEFEYVETDGDLQADLEDPSSASYQLFETAGAILREVHSSAEDPAKILLQPNAHETTADLVVAGMHALPLDTFAASSGGELELWRMLQPDLKLIDELRGWNAKIRESEVAIIHGDLRPDQFLKDTSNGVHLIDGEEVTIGSPLRDLGGMLGSMMFSFLMRSVADARDAAEGGPLAAHQSFTRAADQRLLEFVPFGQAFLGGYGKVEDYTRGRELLAQGIGWAIIERILARSMFGYRLAATDRVILGIGRQAILEPAALDFIHER